MAIIHINVLVIGTSICHLDKVKYIGNYPIKLCIRQESYTVIRAYDRRVITVLKRRPFQYGTVLATVCTCTGT